MEHVKHYRAGSSGLMAIAGIPDRSPHWYCSCGGWVFNATAMPNRKAGNNEIESGKAFKVHLQRVMP